MAKYKLTVVHELEDNEGVQSESELEKYVQDVCSTSIGQWDRVSAELDVRAKGLTRSHCASLASADALHDKKHGWPWHCSLDCLPTEEDENIIACAWNGKYWSCFGFYEFDFEHQMFVDEETVSTLFPSINVYWRTVAAPDLKPKRRPHDSDR